MSVESSTTPPASTEVDELDMGPLSEPPAGGDLYPPDAATLEAMRGDEYARGGFIRRPGGDMEPPHLYEYRCPNSCGFVARNANALIASEQCTTHVDSACPAIDYSGSTLEGHYSNSWSLSCPACGVVVDGPGEEGAKHQLHLHAMEGCPGGLPCVGFPLDPVRAAGLRPPTKKIAIVGYTSSRHQAPFDDPEWECWGLNDLHRFMDPSKFDRWFDLHPVKTITDNVDHVKWLEGGAHGMPVYMWAPAPDRWPTSLPYPVQAVLERFPRYFTNSVSWMIALAILEVVWAAGDGAEVGVFGIDMATDTEYAAQRPSCEMFLGIAIGLGIEVTVPPDSDLLKAAALYGAEEPPMVAKLRARVNDLNVHKAEVEQVHGQTSAQLRQVELDLAATQGAIEATQYMLNVWHQPEKKTGDVAGVTT